MWLHAQQAPGRPLVAVIGKGHVRGVIFVLQFLTSAAGHYQAWLLRQQALASRDGEGGLAPWASLEGAGVVDEALLMEGVQV